MHLHRAHDAADLGARAAAQAATAIRAALTARGAVQIVLATGASQFATLAALAATPGIDWQRITAFHLDEYVGLSASHGASFRRYLQDRFLAHLPVPCRFIAIGGDAADPQAECARLNALLRPDLIDLALIGIGENGHLAFNDPPADLTALGPYHVVRLDEACRRQQVGEGWYPDLAAVPQDAISMTCAAILAAQHIVASVGDARKAGALRDTVTAPISGAVPASVLRRHARCDLYGDPQSFALLPESLRAGGRCDG